MNLREILPRNDEHALVLGQTGGGKTYLARLLLRYKPYVAIYDGKAGMTPTDYPEYEFHDSYNTLFKSVHPRLIYQPPITDVDNFDLIEQFFEWVYYRQNTTLYVDEISTVVKRNVVPMYYKGILQRGRQRNTIVWSGTQRPTWIPIETMTESNHAYVFRLQHMQDRQRVEQAFGISADALVKLPKRYFYYAHLDKILGPLTINL